MFGYALTISSLPTWARSTLNFRENFGVGVQNMCVRLGPTQSHTVSLLRSSFLRGITCRVSFSLHRVTLLRSGLCDCISLLLSTRVPRDHVPRRVPFPIACFDDRFPQVKSWATPSHDHRQSQVWCRAYSVLTLPFFEEAFLLFVRPLCCYYMHTYIYNNGLPPGTNTNLLFQNKIRSIGLVSRLTGLQRRFALQH